MSAYLKKYKPTQDLVVKGDFGAVNIPDVPNVVLEMFNQLVHIKADSLGIAPAEVFEQIVKREGELTYGEEHFNNSRSSANMGEELLQKRAIRLGFYTPPDKEDGP